MSDRDQAPAGGGSSAASSAAVSYQRWRERVDDELRGAPFDSLVSVLPGGIPVQPLYHERPWGKGEHPRGVAGRAPYMRDALPSGEDGWLRCTRIDAPDLGAAKAALAADLRGGCDAVWLVIDVEAGSAGRRNGPPVAGVPLASAEQLRSFLKGVDLDRVAVFLDANRGSWFGPRPLRERMDEDDSDDPTPPHCLGLDPIAELATQGRLERPLVDCERTMALLAATCLALTPYTRAVTVSAVPWHEAGATPVQELGWTIATVARYLRRMEESGLGFEPEDAAYQIALRIAPGRDLFLGIAKLRALRLLWTKLFVACGCDRPPRPFIHAVSSDFALTRCDPWNNLLRVTGEVFAAVAGGADAITAAPYDRLLSSAVEPAGSRLGRRVARNLQHVLAEEAHLGKVADPAGGSYYLETLTEELARRAWDEMRRIEGPGGIGEHLLSGRLRAEAEAAWRERRQAVIEGREPVLGVSVHPPPAGTEPQATLMKLEPGGRGSAPRSRASRRSPAGVAAHLGGERIEPLPRHRLAEPFEDEATAPPAARGEGRAEP